MAEERLRREAERCSRVGTLSFLFSIDGGTAGLASALLQGARDDYPTSTLLGVALSRRGFGTPMAAYNACLALHQLTEYADAAIWRATRLRASSKAGWPPRCSGRSSLLSATRCGLLGERRGLDPEGSEQRRLQPRRCELGGV